MSGILGLLADAEKLTPDQRTQSVKDGVLPPELAGMINSFTNQEVNQTKPEPSNGSSISDQVMSKADEVLDPRQEILEKINNLKDDIGKIQGAIQEGEVKPYVGIPLLEKKFGELQKLQSMIQPPPQQQPQQPQAAQMPQGLNAQQPNQQPPSEGLNALQSNLPQQMAHGGIVNLASGDYIDADDEDDEDEQREFESQMANMPMGEGLGSAIMARADSKKPSMSSFTEGIKSLGKKTVESAKGKSKDLFEDAMKFVLPHEAGYVNHPNDRGGATNRGITQSTLSDYLGRKASIDDVKNLSEETARDIYKRNFWEPIDSKVEDPKAKLVAFNASIASGPRYADRLIAKHKGDPYGMLDEHTNFMVNEIPKNNPSQKVFVKGWANRQKDLNDYIQNFAEGGIVGLAHGGKIKHFYAGNKNKAINDNDMTQIDDIGGQLDEAKTALQGLQSFGSQQKSLIPDYDKKLQDAINSKNSLQKQYENLMTLHGANKTAFGLYPAPFSQGKSPTPSSIVQAMTPQYTPPAPAIPKENTAPLTMAPPDNEQALPDYTNDVPYSPNGASQPLPIEESKEETKKSNMDSFMDYMNQSREDLKKAHETDKYMGLLMAGLGMMGGTSQFAGANIGKGAAQGVQHFADLQKQQAAEKANLDKLDLYGRRAQETSDLYRSMRQTPEERAYALQEQLDVKRNAQRGLDEERLNKRLSGRQTQIENNVRNLLKMDTVNNITDPDIINKYNSAVSRALASDKHYNDLYKQVYGTDYNIPNISEIAGLPKIKEIGGKTYVLQDNGKYKEK